MKRSLRVFSGKGVTILALVVSAGAFQSAYAFDWGALKGAASNQFGQMFKQASDTAKQAATQAATQLATQAMGAVAGKVQEKTGLDISGVAGALIPGAASQQAQAAPSAADTNLRALQEEVSKQETTLTAEQAAILKVQANTHKADEDLAKLKKVIISLQQQVKANTEGLAAVTVEESDDTGTPADEDITTASTTKLISESE